MAASRAMVLGACVRRISSSPWRCLHGARSCRSSPTILHGCRPSPRPEPGLGRGLRQVAAPPGLRDHASCRSLADAMRSAPWLSRALDRVLPLIALWFARGTDRLQTLVMTLVALLGFVRAGPAPPRTRRGARCCTLRIGPVKPPVPSARASPISMRNAPSRFAWRPSANARVSPARSTTMWGTC